MTEASKRIERIGHLQWVPIRDMRVSPKAQRELRRAWVDHLAADFDLEALGYPTVNQRDDTYFVLDGQHRIEALRQMGWGDQQIQCWTYKGMTEAEEAEEFLRLNNTLTIHAFDKFAVAVVAEREDATDIDRIVRSSNLVVSREDVPGAVSCVGTMTRIYHRAGPATFARVLRIVRDSFGDPGLDAQIIGGIGLLCQRYNGQLNEATVIDKLSRVSAGATGFLGQVEKLRNATRAPKQQCVAAVAVEIVNRGAKRGERLPNWWADD